MNGVFRGTGPVYQAGQFFTFVEGRNGSLVTSACLNNMDRDTRSNTQASDVETMESNLSAY